MGTFLKELPELVSNNIISPDTAKNIENYYASRKAPQDNNLMAIFGVLGATLTGLGIILIFAHNWDTFSKGIKTMLALLPLITFQALAAYTIIKGKSTVWKQAAGTLLFFAVGASIALIAQIYNIPGNIGSFLCTWTLLCLPLMYLLKANALGILHIVFATWYATAAGYDDHGTPLMYLVFIAAFIPFYIERHKTLHLGFIAFMNLLLPLSSTIVLGTFLDSNYTFNCVVYLSFFGMLYTIGQLEFFQRFGFRGNGYHAISQTGIIVILIIMSFRWFWEEGSKDTMALQPGIIWSACMVMACLLAIKSRLLKKADPFLIAVLVSPVIYFIGMANEHVGMIAVNLSVLALGIAIIRKGVAKLDFPTVNFGLVIISILIICRFFDTDITFALRGILFVTVGAGFFATNYLLIRKKQTLQETHHEN